MTNGHGETSIPLQLVVVVGGGGIRTQIVNEELLSFAKDAKTDLFLSCSELYFPHVLTINVEIF